MNVLFVNNTSLYHCGSLLTCKNLIDLIKPRCKFLEILAHSARKDMRFYDVIIINGEGSFHHNKMHSPAKEIYYCAEEFKKNRKKSFSNKHSYSRNRL